MKAHLIDDRLDFHKFLEFIVVLNSVVRHSNGANLASGKQFFQDLICCHVIARHLNNSCTRIQSTLSKQICPTTQSPIYQSLVTM